MKLQLVGNIVALHHTVESFKNHQRIELLHKRSSERKILLLASLGCLAIYALILIFVFICSITTGIALLILVSAFLFLIIYRIFSVKPFYALKSKEDIDKEVIESAGKTYGERFAILESFQSGFIFSAMITGAENKSKLHSVVTLNFKCANDSKGIKTHTIRSTAIKTSDNQCCGILYLNIETGNLTYYCQDELPVGMELEITNQFLPKG